MRLLLALKGIKNLICPIKEKLLAMYPELLQVEHLLKEQYQDKNFPSYQGWVENSSVNPPLPWFKPILIKW